MLFSYPSYLTYHSTGNLRTGVAGGLGVEIVRAIVNDHRAPDDFGHREAVGGNALVGASVAPNQWGQVAGMCGMRCFFGIIVAAGAGKIGSAAVVALVDVKAEKPGFCGRQAFDVDGYQHRLFLLVKPDLSTGPGAGTDAFNRGYGVGITVHTITSLYSMSPVANRCLSVKHLAS